MAEGKEVRRITHYSSDHEILLVGEGDFSFSLSLAKAFGSADNIVATSLDAYDELTRTYSRAESNVSELKRLGAKVLHGVDATKMFAGGVHGELNRRKFDRIIFNFPHSGVSYRGRFEQHPSVIASHKQLVEGFLRNTASMLRSPSGEVHVAHKTAYPFSNWDIVDLASACSLILLEEVIFRKEDYPNYCNKRGWGGVIKADESFPLGTCSTFKFGLKLA